MSTRVIKPTAVKPATENIATKSASKVATIADLEFHVNKMRAELGLDPIVIKES
jgi:hypothetical protein